jgi:hypothetical protein
VFQHSSVTYTETISDFEKAIAWLEGMGISTRTKRHAKYLRTLKTIDEEWQKRGDMRASDIPIEPKLMTTSAAEAFQLIRIWRAFADRPPEGLKAKLKILAGGPSLEAQENPAKSGNSARDCGFELEVAASFSGLGDVELKRGVDVAVSHQGISLFVECKRPSSPTMIAENLDRAAEQIMSELNATRLASYGIPAISVVKSEWAGGVVIKATTMPQLHHALRSWTARVDKDYLAPWFRRQSDSRMVAVLLHIPYEGDFKDEPPMAGVQLNLVIGCRPRTVAHRDLMRLRASLGSAF